jgi:formylglycine-generating enzyme required for sulfatase activity
MVRIPAGSFLMGSPDTERSRVADEGPVHEVTIGYDFYMGETEVTQGQWEAVMGSNPATGFGVGRDYPVYNVSWDDCQAFLTALNALGQGTFRLPSESEWEYACRAGTTTRFHFGDSLGCADDCANCGPEKIIFVVTRFDFMWYCGNYGGGSQPVGQKFANGFGLVDMHGNVFEWCQDFYRSDYDFTGIPIDGSAWESGGLVGIDPRVIRGGFWNYDARYCRSAARAGGYGGVNIGFRLARTP